IKHGAGKRCVNELVAQSRRALVGDGKGGELLAMRGQFLGEVGKAENERARGRGVDAGRGDGAGFAADWWGGGGEAPVLEPALTALRCRTGRALRSPQRVEAVEPVLAIKAGEVRVADGRGVGDEPRREARHGL